MKRIKQLFCKHKKTLVIYRNEKPCKNLRYIIKYSVVICEKCKKRTLINEGSRNPYKIIR